MTKLCPGAYQPIAFKEGVPSKEKINCEKLGTNHMFGFESTQKYSNNIWLLSNTYSFSKMHSKEEQNTNCLIIEL